MQVEFRLKKILRKCNKDKHGMYSEAARGTGLHWKTIKGIYENTTRKLDRDTIGKLCAWLEYLGLGAGLPGALLGYRPSSLIRALAEPGHVTIYLGEYRSRADESRRWVCTEDAAVGSAFVELLSNRGEHERDGDGDGDADDDSEHDRAGRAAPPRYEHVYVPFRFDGGAGCTTDEVRRDATVAEAWYAKMRGPDHDGTAIMIGALRNYMVELFIADVFNCEPFVPAAGSLPVYMLHAAARRPSCFGGPVPPPGCDVDRGPGLYFRTGSGDWEAYPSNGDGEDSGVVILRRDAGEARPELAVFGCSPRATAALAAVLRDSPDDFWQFGSGACNPEVRVYACRFELGLTACTAHHEPAVRIRRKEVTLVSLES